MRTILLVLLLSIGVTIPKYTTSQSPDVVLALKPIQKILKGILRQDAMDYDVYKKMADYQKALKTVYEIQGAIKGLQTYIEVIKQIEAFACAIRGLDELMNDINLNIPFNGNTETISTCGFNFKYKSVLTSFSMANDMVDMTLSNLQMTASERVSILSRGFISLNTAFEGIQKLKNAIINYNR
ncbi:MAG: hypothetical protein AB8F74_19390 [Saprospiraceae bacterium]